jgi:hypothetical protein
MINKVPGELSPKLDEHFDMPAMIRLGAWGLGAVLAVVVAVFAASANMGTRHSNVATTTIAKSEAKLPSETKAAPEPPRMTTAAELIARANEPDGETKRLAEAVRLLTADRDRLTTRIAALERNIDDLTGSISRQPAPAPPPSPTPRSLQSEPSPPPVLVASIPPGPAAVPQAVAAPPPLTRPSISSPAPQFDPPPTPPPPATAAPSASMAPAATTVPVPRPGRMATIEYYARSAPEPADRGQFGHESATDESPAGSVATATDFGVDLGGATSVNGLRSMWGMLRTKHAQLLNGLWPIMSVRDRAKPGTPGTVELRLVAGPLPNAAHAARLCATFAGLGVACQPAVFDGQRLALR